MVSIWEISKNAKSEVFAVRHAYARLREVAAVTVAWLDVNVRHPMPVLGEKLPIL